jgi:hypothetical protein
LTRFSPPVLGFFCSRLFSPPRVTSTLFTSDVVRSSSFSSVVYGMHCLIMERLFVSDTFCLGPIFVTCII